MADRQRAREILAARARSLAEVGAAAAEGEAAEDYLVLVIAGQRIGIRLASVQEVVPATGLAPIPRAPRWLRGVAHVRGALVAVLDLARWWKLDEEVSGKYLVVLVGRSGAVAITSNAEMEVRSIGRQEIVPGDESVSACEGLTAVSRDMVFFLDVDLLTGHPDLTIGASGAARACPGGGRDG